MRISQQSIHGIGLVTGAVLLLGALCGCGPSAPAPSAGLARTATNLVATVKTNLLAAQSSPTNVSAVTSNRSIFVEDLKDARDPFFPTSTSGESKPGANAVAAAPKVSPESLLELNSIVGSASMRLASINGRTFLAGEEKVVTTSSGTVRVRCLEVGSQSATILVNGRTEPRILSLSKRSN